MSTIPTHSAAPGFQRLTAHYQPPDDSHDELLTPGREPRTHWRPLLDSLANLGPGEIRRREESAVRILREHGATYHVHGEDGDPVRPWELDLLPLLVPAAEWRVVEQGLAQRARLLNALLEDIYGPQRTLREGVLPPAMVHANPAFLRSCHGLRPSKGLHLVRYAVDLARSPDGQWWALSDRSQAPSGAGYSLENRVVASQLLPNEFYLSQVRQVAPFFDAERQALRRLAPRPEGEPHVVMLTPGPRSETYFEHAFLAGHQGFTLVEGEDLTVRDERVFLKTLEGLRPVDVIVRRVDEHYCDPLELDATSCLGVPGLVHAVRARTVAVANALGSGAVEGASLLAFFPSLCRFLLGEQLLLPSIATWWCGQAREMSYVLENLESLVIKPAFPGLKRQPVAGSRLSAADRDKLRARIQDNPSEFVGQEQVRLSTTPVWEQGVFAPRPLVLRAFVVLGDAGATVMPGGLTRVAPSRDDALVSSRTGGASKDTWVLADPEHPEPPASLPRARRRSARVPLQAGEVASRVADNLFWMGRYAERIEDGGRLLRCALQRLAGENFQTDNPELSGLTALLRHLGVLSERSGARVGAGELERELVHLVFRANTLGTIQELRYRLRQTAFVVRDRLSADTWRVLERLDTEAGIQPGRIPLESALALLNALIINLSALNGMEMENMVRGHGWLFLDLGRRLERAMNLITLMAAGLAVESSQRSILQPLLEIADSTISYRRLQYARAFLGPVLELLLLTARNPRSLIFQLNGIAEHVDRLPGVAPEEGASDSAEVVRAALAGLNEIAVDDLWKASRNPWRDRLIERLNEIGERLAGLSQHVTRQYFSHAETRVT
ncbi:MAG: circularly permuted type 2 ATP-grasp protein [Verrucomicrobiales bacterium]|nr:circularly permuted type 2 ATP-grasp protein [Verrucomicrobiales bacterium]